MARCCRSASAAIAACSVVRELRTATLLHSSVPEQAARLARTPAGGYTCWSRLKRHPRRGRPPRPGKRSLKTEQRAIRGFAPDPTGPTTAPSVFGAVAAKPRHVVRDSVYVTGIRYDDFPFDRGTVAG